jgi:microcin C transport system substrate-binding protein
MFERKSLSSLHSTGCTMTFPHLLIYLFLGILFSGCGDSSESNNQDEPTGNGALQEDVFQPSYGERDPIALENTNPGGTFITWGGSFPKSLNMFLDYNSFSATVMGLLYEPLISLHSTDNRPVGVLAETWEIGEDGMTFTFKIREDAAWSDGKPITSADIQFFYDVILDPANLTSLFRVSLKRFERPVALDE